MCFRWQGNDDMGLYQQMKCICDFFRLACPDSCSRENIDLGTNYWIGWLEGISLNIHVFPDQPFILVSHRQVIGTDFDFLVVLALFKCGGFLSINITIMKQLCFICNGTNVCCCLYCCKNVDLLCFLTDNSSH